MDLNSNRRKSNRFKSEAVILHDNLLPGIFYEAKIYNFSKAGVYFESDQVLYPGEKIYIGLKSQLSSGKNAKNYTRVEIRWRRELQDASFQYGYGAKFIDSSHVFIKKIDEGDLEKQRLLDSHLTKDKDPREHPRKSYRKVVVFTSRNIKYKGSIKNISRGGAFIITQKKFVLGQMIKLVIPATKIQNQVKLKGWVVRVDPNGIGVRFDRRTARDRRSDLDRRRGIDRRRRGRYRYKDIVKS